MYLKCNPAFTAYKRHPKSMQTQLTPNRFTIWWLAIRPQTLLISISPILVASVMAFVYLKNYAISLPWIVLIMILLSTLAIQIGTNLFNDAKDFEKGADTNERLGPKRAVQQGWLTAREVKFGAHISFIIAFLGGIYLAYIGGLVIIILGLISIACGYAYTAGKLPIAYSPLGELFALLFFGVFAVSGSYYLLTLNYQNQIILMGSVIGCYAAAILLINNYRDLEQDRKANKLTLVNYIKRPAARILFLLLLIYPYLALILLKPDPQHFLWWPLLTIPLTIKLVINLYQFAINKFLNQILAQTALLQFMFSCLFSAQYLTLNT